MGVKEAVARAQEALGWVVVVVMALATEAEVMEAGEMAGAMAAATAAAEMVGAAMAVAASAAARAVAARVL